MTLKSFRDIVIVKYMAECRRRGVPELEIGNGEFKVYYDLVMNEITTALRIQYTTQDITLTAVTVYTEYALNSSFGGLVNYELVVPSGGQPQFPEFKDISEMPTAGDLTAGSPNSIAIFPKGDGLHYVYLYPLVSVAGTLRIRYKLNFAVSNGATSDYDLTAEDLILPNEYFDLMLTGMMYQLFPDTYPVFKAKLLEAPHYSPTPTKGFISYSLGGYDDDTPDNGFSKNFNGE